MNNCDCCLCVKCENKMTCEYHRKCIKGNILYFAVDICVDFKPKKEGKDNE